MSMRGFNKKLFLIYLLLSQGVAKANWQSLYEEFEEFDNKNLYMYPIDVNASYIANLSTRFKAADKIAHPNDAYTVLTNFGDKNSRCLCSFFNQGFRIDAGVLMTGYGFAKKFYCFPRLGLMYQHLFFNMKLKENGSADDFIFYFSPVTAPTATFEVVPRIGLGLSYLSMPREYYSKLQKIQDGINEDGSKKYKLENDAPINNYLYDGIDLAFLYELVFRLRFVPEWSVFATVGGVWRPLLFKKGIFKGKAESSLKKNSYEEKVYNFLKLTDGGFGTLGASLGFNYNFAPACEKPEWYNQILRNNDKKCRFRLEGIFGARDKYKREIIDNSDSGSNEESKIVIARGKECIVGGNLKTLFQFSNSQALGVGFGFIADYARKVEIKDLPSSTEYVNIHVGLVHDFIYNRLIISNFFGFNTKKNDRIGEGNESQKPIMGRIFWEPSCTVKLNRFFFVGMGAHIGLFSAPLEYEHVENFEMKDIKNKADVLKLEYLNLSLGIDWVVEPFVEYYE